MIRPALPPRKSHYLAKSTFHSPKVEFENNYFTEMCSGSEAGSYLRLIDYVHHSTLGLRVIKKKKKKIRSRAERKQLKRVEGLLTGGQRYNLALTVLYVP